ncbi:MAG: hypothetical protein ACW963_05585 [Candidatus Sifarchaeia archaeon]|jgi:hypothetical protein
MGYGLTCWSIREEGERYALKKGLMFFETSAKTGEHVVDVMEELGKKLFLIAAPKVHTDK